MSSVASADPMSEPRPRMITLSKVLMRMELETIFTILDNKEVKKEYKGSYYNSVKEIVETLLSNAYGSEGTCDKLTINKKIIRLPHSRMGNLDSTKLLG